MRRRDGSELGETLQTADDLSGQEGEWDATKGMDGLNAAVSKDKAIRENLRSNGGSSETGLTAERQKQGTEIEMESMLPIYTGVK